MTKYILTAAGVLLLAFLASSWYWIAHKVTFRGDVAKGKSPLVIFDFDGTICPSYRLFIEQVNFLAAEYHLRKIGVEEQESFRDMEPRSIMKALGVSSFKLPFLLKKARHNAQKQLVELEPVEGIVEVLRELKRQGCSLGILTSNSAENVRLYLQRHKIDLFDFIYAGNNIFGKDKHLIALLQKAELRPERDCVVYVGDETRDMQAARKAHLKGIGVTWGYNSPQLLRQSKPDVLCNTASEILNFFPSQTLEKK